MLKNYFKIAWRNLLRHKSYAIINIAGLTAGIASCLLIFVVVNFELSFDKDQPNYHNLYHVVTLSSGEDNLNYTPGVPTPAVDALRLEFPEAKVAALNTSYGSQFTIAAPGGNAAADKKIIEPFGVFFMQPQFFELFKFKWLAGSASVLKQPDMVVIDQSTATKYFGDWQQAMGKTIKMDNTLNLKVAGILADAPSNSDFQVKVAVSYLTWKQHPNEYNYNYDWHSNSSNHQIYMLFPEGASQQKIDARLKAFSDKYHENNVTGQGRKHVHFVQPLAAMHFDTRFGNTIGDHQTSMATLRTLSFIAMLIIVMASINFINLSTAQSVGRSKEVGVRKVLGSSRLQLIGQVLGETTLIVVLSVVLAIVVAKLALPYLKNIASVPDDIGLFSINTVAFLFIVTLIIILLSGVYPALTLSGFKPVLALKNKINAASVGGIPLRRVLVIAQFTISQVLIIGTIVAIRQMNYVNNADLGFNKSAVLMIPGYTDSISLQKMATVKQQLLANPKVTSVSFTSDAPSSENNWVQNIYYNHNGEGEGYNTNLKYADADYFKTFKFQFLAGHGYAASDTMQAIVVNETFIRKLGIKRPQDAIGKDVRLGARSAWVPIVGVIKDYKTNSLREEIRPILMGSYKGYESQLAVRLNTGNLIQTVAEIKAIWERNYPEYAYNGGFLDESIAQFYQQENQLALVYKVFAGIAIFISCLGLYGLVSFMTLQKTKEVGVRKVLGASVASIVYLFSKEFMLLILLSFVIAMPVAWYVMSAWLQSFAYRIGLSAGIFVVAIAASMLIAWVTVGYKAVKAALVTPVRSLRSE
ncbi:ABC transporter permease [Mucilaginibacter koreensis]